MEDLSLHLLDLVQNSLAAEGDEIKITILENWEEDFIKITIEDNGKGMDKSTLDKVLNPFYTTRTTRKVGLGLPLFKASCEACDGYLKIDSKLGLGTKVEARLKYEHLDRPPFGSLKDSLITLIHGGADRNFYYRHESPKGEFILDTKEIKNIIGEISIDHPEVINFLYTYIEEGLKEIDGGVN